MSLLSGRGRSGNTPPLLPGSGWTANLLVFATAVMAFLAVLSLAASLAVQSVASQWRADLADVATVRISAMGAESGERLRAVLEVLRTTPGIARVRPLGADEQRALVAPWLGAGTDLESLPMPQLVEVMLTGEGPDPAALQQRLDLTVDGAVYDNHAAWRGPLTRVADGLENVALGAAVLIFLTVAALVAFSARTSLIANRSVVVTLRLMGAEDGFIARAFIGPLVMQSATGAVIGAVAGAIVVLLLPEVDAADPSLRIGVGPDATGWALLTIGVPVFCVAITWIAARAAVTVALNRLP